MNPMPTLQDLAKVAALRSEVTLQPHQQKVVDRINSGDKRLLLYHGLGSGKSLSSLAAAEAAGDDYDVVVPAALRPNYQKEVAKFTEGSNPEVLSYTGIGAGKAFQTPPKTIIFDEAHRLRNPGTASTQAATELANQAENLLLLTGTPITNSPKDLAPLLSMLRKEKITPEQFEQNYIGHRKVYPTWLSRLTGRGVGEEAYVKNEANLREQLKGLIDYQPSKTPEGVNVNEETVRVPLSRGQARIQKAVRDKIPPEYAWKLDKEYPLTRDELSRMNSFLTGLRQSSLSTQPFRGDRDPLNAFDESSKLQKAFGDLQETLKTDPRKKALIYSNYIDAGLGPYAAALQRAKIPYGMYHGSMPVAERKKALQGYNEGTLKALLLGPAAAEGISTQGTSLIQLLDPHWHESRGRQAEGRGLRFDSHEGLPPELKNVAIKRYLSESQDPSFIMSLLGARRQRTGDEILERLAANKEQLNNQFRKILQEEGSSMNKQSSIPDFDSVQELAKMAAEEHALSLAKGGLQGLAKAAVEATPLPNATRTAAERATQQLGGPGGKATSVYAKYNYNHGEDTYRVPGSNIQRIKAAPGAQPVIPQFPMLAGKNPMDAELRRDHAATALHGRNYSRVDSYPGNPTPMQQQSNSVTGAPARDQAYANIVQNLGNANIGEYNKQLNQKFHTAVHNPRQTYTLKVHGQEPLESAGVASAIDPWRGYKQKPNPVLHLGAKAMHPDLQRAYGHEPPAPRRALNAGSVGLHELEHVNQLNAPEDNRQYYDYETMAGKYENQLTDKPSPEIQDPMLPGGYKAQVPYEANVARSFKHEFPATLSDIVQSTDTAENVLGRPVVGNMPITDKYQPSLDWMKNQAKQHGHLSGDKTMTELLNTPSGQAWLRQRMEEVAPPVGQQYDNAVKALESRQTPLSAAEWKQAPSYFQRDATKAAPVYKEMLRRQNGYPTSMSSRRNKQASMATGLFSMAKKIVPKAISSVMPKNGWRGAVKSLAGQSAEAAYRPFKDPLKAFWQPHIAGRSLPVGLASAAYGTVSAANSARNQLKAGLLPTPVAKFVGPERTNEFNAQLPSSLYSLVKANVTTQPNPADRAALQGTVNYGWDKLKSGIRSQLTYAAPSIPTGKPLAVAGVQRLASQFIPPRTTTPKNLTQHIQDQWAAKNISMKDRQDSEASRQAENLSRILYARRPKVGN